MEKKAAVLVVSFGTSHIDTMNKTILVIESRIRDTFPDAEIYRAFTSNMIIQKLKKEHGLEVDTVEEAVNRIVKAGYDTLFVQPTHIINGVENDYMLDTILSYKPRFSRLGFGTPLLSCSDDYIRTARIIGESFPLQENEVLLLMGHGTDHHANAAYPALDYTFKEQGYDRIFVGTVEGYPKLPSVLEMVKQKHAEKIFLLPFMLVAGEHAKYDMAGKDEDSWKTILEKEGYTAVSLLKGLGELPAIQELYIEHLKSGMGLPVGSPTA